MIEHRPQRCDRSLQRALKHEGDEDGMKMFLCMTLLSACSFEVGGLGNETEWQRGLRGQEDRTAVLVDVDSGGAAVDVPDERDAGSQDDVIDAEPVPMDADSATAEEAIVADSGMAIEEDAAIEPQPVEQPALTRELFVGSWAQVSGAECEGDATATLDTTPCNHEDCTELLHFAIGSDYAIDSIVDFVGWQDDVWTGERSDPSFKRSLQMWLVSEDTMLGDFRRVDLTGATETVCRSWRMVRL